MLGEERLIVCEAGEEVAVDREEALINVPSALNDFIVEECIRLVHHRIPSNYSHQRMVIYVLRPIHGLEREAGERLCVCPQKRSVHLALVPAMHDESHTRPFPNFQAVK